MFSAIKKFFTAKKPVVKPDNTFCIIERMNSKTGELYYKVHKGSLFNDINARYYFNMALGNKSFANVPQCEAAIAEYRVAQEREDHYKVISTGL